MDIIQEALETRGRHATRVSWTKGHASVKAIRDGSVSIWAAMSNSLADKAAGSADEAAGTQSKVGILGYFARKQKAYSKLIAAIMRRIIRVTVHTRSFRKAAEEEQAKDGANKFVDTPGVPKFDCIRDYV